MRPVEVLKSVSIVAERTPGLRLGYKAASIGERRANENYTNRRSAYTIEAKGRNYGGWLTGLPTQFWSPRAGLILENAIDSGTPLHGLESISRTWKDFAKDTAATLVTVAGIRVITLALQPEIVIPAMIFGKLVFNAAENAYLEVKNNRTRR